MCFSYEEEEVFKLGEKSVRPRAQILLSWNQVCVNYCDHIIKMGHRTLMISKCWLWILCDHQPSAQDGMFIKIMVISRNVTTPISLPLLSTYNKRIILKTVVRLQDHYVRTFTLTKLIKHGLQEVIEYLHKQSCANTKIGGVIKIGVSSQFEPQTKVTTPKH